MIGNFLSEFQIDDVHVKIEAGENGLFYGTSKDEPGLLIAKPSRVEVFKAAPEAISELRSLKADVNS